MEKTDEQSAAHEAERNANVVELPQRAPGRGSDGIASFARDHPLLVVAGGIAAGALAAALLPKGTGRRLARRAIGLAELAGSTGVILGNQMREQAEAAGAGLRDRGDAMAERLEKFSETATDRWDGLSDAAAARMEKLGDATATRMGKLRDPIEHAAGKVAKKASELRSRARH